MRDAYWYSSAQEIADTDKALSRWLKDGVLPGSSPRPANPARSRNAIFPDGVRNHLTFGGFFIAGGAGGEAPQSEPIPGCARIFREKASGGRWDRPQLLQLLTHLRPGERIPANEQQIRRSSGPRGRGW